MDSCIGECDPAQVADPIDGRHDSPAVACSDSRSEGFITLRSKLHAMNRLQHAAYSLTLAAVAAAPNLAAQTVTQSWAFGGTFLGGVAYDYYSNTIWTIDSSRDEISQYTRGGTLIQTFPAPLMQVVGGFVHPNTGNLWVVDETEMVFEFTRTGVATGVQWSTAPSITDASAITHDPDSDTIYVSNDSGNVIGEFDLSGASIRRFNVSGAGSVDADGLVYNPLTQTFYLGEDTGDQIIEVNRLGGLVATFALGGLGISPEGLSVDTRTGSLFIGSTVGNTLFEVAGIVPACVGSVTEYGQGCPDSGGTVPFASASGCPVRGRSISFGCRYSPTITAPLGFVILDFTRGNANLGPFRAPACTALTPLFNGAVAPLSIVNGEVGFTVTWPMAPGNSVNMQFGIFPDFGAGSGGSLPLALSNGVEVQG